jgi:hypothetical protein
MQLDQFIDIMAMDLQTKELSVLATNPPLLMANGMTLSADGRSILAISQGFDATGGGVYLLDPETQEVSPVFDSFYGTNFNSPNDIETTSDGIMFVSDPVYGFEQGFRTSQPALGSNVYRYDSDSKDLTVLTTQLQRPNGIALLDDRANGNGCTLFLTDSGFEGSAQAPRGFDGWGESAMYIMKDSRDGCFDPVNGPFPLQPWQPVVAGIQDGIHVHDPTQTLLYCDGNGVWVWSIPLVRPLGLITIPCTQLIFDRTESGLQELFILAETELYSTNLVFDTDALPVAVRNLDTGGENETLSPGAIVGIALGAACVGVLVGAMVVYRRIGDQR